MIRRLERDAVPHNLIAHPLLIVCPPVGRWLHDRTSPTAATIYGRRVLRSHGYELPIWPHFHLFLPRRWWR